ncbi:MAG: ankyrin repeat domain-containing protein [Magnetococcales bacterium]|nr:ankyrin repeat domain-containing protein [Magnetococcales bacterium]
MLIRWAFLSMFLTVCLFAWGVQAGSEAVDGSKATVSQTQGVKAADGQQGAAASTPDQNGNTTLMVAAKDGKGDAVQALIDGGADVNAQNKDGMTALMFASQRGHADVVAVLVAANAKVNMMNNDGATARLLAKEGGHDAVDMMLKEAGGRCL